MAKNKALDNIYSLFKQNIKSCNAKRPRQRWRTVKNNKRSNKQKSNFAHAAHAFVHIFAKNEKSQDYCKADLKQRVLFFYNNISAGHTSLLQVYKCY